MGFYGNVFQTKDPPSVNLKHLDLENISVFSCDGKHYHKITLIFLRENISINFSNGKHFH